MYIYTGKQYKVINESIDISLATEEVHASFVVRDLRENLIFQKVSTLEINTVNTCCSLA